MSSTTNLRPKRQWRAALLLGSSMIPAALAVLPLTLGSAWYLSADENEAYLTGGRVVWELISFAIALAPFLGAVVALVSLRLIGQSWWQACRVAAIWVLGLGCIAFVAAMAHGGGF